MLSVLNKFDLKARDPVFSADYQAWAFLMAFHHPPPSPGGRGLMNLPVRAIFNNLIKNVLRSGSRNHTLPPSLTEEKKCSCCRKQAQRLAGVHWTKL